jgi:hypothetical protein
VWLCAKSCRSLASSASSFSLCCSSAHTTATPQQRSEHETVRVETIKRPRVCERRMSTYSPFAFPPPPPPGNMERNHISLRSEKTQASKAIVSKESFSRLLTAVLLLGPGPSSTSQGAASGCGLAARGSGSAAFHPARRDVTRSTLFRP